MGHGPGGGGAAAAAIPGAPPGVDLDPSDAMAVLTADPSKLSSPIKDIKDKWQLLPAFLQVRSVLAV